ncbi:MAG: ExbD/TolR family protein [Candidatus Glassbacteria bacterium]
METKVESKIPSASLADIAFLLFIFFAVSTTFRAKDYPGKKPELPQAKATEKVEERVKDILHLWVIPDGTVWINDVQVPMEGVAGQIQPILMKQPRLIVAVKADKDAEFGMINKVLDQLKIAGAVRVNFATLKERETNP